MIDRITMYPVRVPMHRPFAHAGKTRDRTASVLVAVDGAGARGWGEGAPRRYVTGETVAGAVAALRGIRVAELNALLDLSDFGTAVRQLAVLDHTRLFTVDSPVPAARAALELALFDLVCRVHGRSGMDGLRAVPEVVPLLRAVPVPAAVSLVLDLATDPVGALDRLGAGPVAAIRHVKLKAGTDTDDAVRRVARVRERLPAGTRISVDVNGAWDVATALPTARRLAALGVSWLEEPVSTRDWAGMREIQRVAGMPVMLDESCTGPDDAHAAAEQDAAGYLNARISKCGGLFPTLALVATGRRLGLGAQLGVHVGEVGPLWAAGRLLAGAVGGLATVEAGRQDEWFPTPLTDPPYTVDRGRYLAPPLDGPGLVVTPTETLLRQVFPDRESAGARP